MIQKNNVVIAAKSKEDKFFNALSDLPPDAVLLTWEDAEAKMCLWHSSAHIMAESILQHYPDAKLTIGPPIEEGFYYDVDFGNTTFKQEDIPKIEETFIAIVKKAHLFTEEEVIKEQAITIFLDNPYKLELIKSLPDNERITLYHSGSFTDLCKGPHIICTSDIIKSFKILNIAGSYWKGNSANKQLTRIYAITFPSTELLSRYLEHQEMLKTYDHRVIGEKLRLFCFSENVGNGLPLWLPNGFEVRQSLQNEMMYVQKKLGYKYVITPHLAKSQLYKVSGHYEKYKDSSFSEFSTPDEKEQFMLKPMNCPHHAEIFKAHPKSYKELPVRLAENGNVCRYEPSGTLHGLTRVRAFCQDDAHIFCRQDQLGEEIGNVIELVRKIFGRLGFNNYKAQISVRDKMDFSKYIGTSSDWDKAENDLIKAAKEFKLESTIVEGEAAFYGPKIDIQLTDSMNRSWQLSTIQIDYQLPERFGLEYTGADNEKHRPVMIHRAIFGSYERLFAILLEHYKGNLPVWLAPIQAIIVTVKDECISYATQVADKLMNAGFRIETDFSQERLSKKILNAEMLCIPYVLIIGKKEVDQKTVNVRSRYQKWQKEYASKAFIDLLITETKRETL